MKFTNTKEFKFKSGIIVPVGTSCELQFQEGASVCTVHAGSVKFRMQLTSLPFYFNKIKVPSLETAGKWIDDGIARSILGKKVEPDGHDDEGSPSWLLVMGLI